VPTLVATAGASNANVFADQATADAYMEARPFASVWEGEDDDDVKERALLFATKILDRLKWAGTKADADQALSWPRRFAPTLEADADPDIIAENFIDESMAFYDETTIPQFLQDATCELALALLATTDPFLRDVIRIKSKTVDVLTTEYFASQEDIRGIARFPHVVGLISHALRSSARGAEILRT
jgi:hypothetical protein